MPFVRPAYAAVNICDSWSFCKNNPNQTLAGLVSSFLPKALLVAGIIFFFLIVFAGFAMVTSAGSGGAENAERAKAFLTSSIIGLVIIFGAFFVLQIINFITGGSLGAILGT